MAESVIRQLIAVAATVGAPDVATAHGTLPAPPQETMKPLPAKVQRALVLQFPARNSERAAHEAMARDLIAAGESESSVERMLAEGRQIDL